MTAEEFYREPPPPKPRPKKRDKRGYEYRKGKRRTSERRRRRVYTQRIKIIQMVESNTDGIGQKILTRDEITDAAKLGFMDQIKEVLRKYK